MSWSLLESNLIRVRFGKPGKELFSPYKQPSRSRLQIRLFRRSAIKEQLNISTLAGMATTEVRQRHLDARASEPAPDPNGQPQSARRRMKKYRHIAAAHSVSQPSCLSHDSHLAPSFLGFRNLMVICLSTSLSQLAFTPVVEAVSANLFHVSRRKPASND